MRNRLVALSIAAVVAAACGSDNTSAPVSKIVRFTATMTPAGELGATLNGSPSGSGTFTASLDTSTNILTWNFTFTGMTSNVNNGHIHGPFPSGTANAAGVILNFDPASNPVGATGLVFTGLKTANAGSGSGTITLGSAVIGGGVSGDSLKKLLLSGNVYVNIHTTTNPGGEIRAQISRAP
jgi:CHRD domain-containing protein